MEGAPYAPPVDTGDLTFGDFLAVLPTAARAMAAHPGSFSILGAFYVGCAAVEILPGFLIEDASLRDLIGMATVVPLALATTIVMIGMYRMGLAYAREEPVQLGLVLRSWRGTAKAVLIMLLVTVLSSAAFCFLVVPGLYLMTVLQPATVLSADRDDAGSEVMADAVQLTEGVRWSLFLQQMILMVPFVVVSGVLPGAENLLVPFVAMADALTVEMMLTRRVGFRQ